MIQAERPGRERRRRIDTARADVEVDRDHQPARPEAAEVVAEHGDRVGHVEEHEAPDDRVERRVVLPGRDVRLGEADVRRTGSRGAFDRHLECSGGLIERRQRIPWARPSR